VLRSLGIRAGEGRLVALVAALFATLDGARAIADATADTLFITRFGQDALPYLFIVLGPIGMVVALGYGTAVGSVPRRILLPAILAGIAGLLIAEWALLRVAPAPAPPLVWVTVQAMGALLATLVWTVAGTSLTARQAKRLLPLCTGAAILGAFAGSILVGPLVLLLGLENALLVVALLLLVAAWLARSVSASTAEARPAASRAASGVGERVRMGFEFVRASPLMRLVAFAYVLFGILFFAVSYPYYGAMRQGFPDEVAFASATGLIQAAVTVGAFVVSVGLTGRIFARFGIGTAALLLPLVYLAGFGAWLVAFTLPTAVAFRIAQQVTQRGISNASWGAMYNVVPVERRPQVLAFMDGVPTQVGTTIVGVLLLIVQAVLSPNQLFGLGLAAAAACAWLVWQVRRRYGAALLASLRAGLGEQVLEGGPGLTTLGRDAQLLVQLDAALDDPVPATRRLAAELLARLDARQAVPHLASLAQHDPDGEVRAAAVAALGRLTHAAQPDRSARASAALTSALRDGDARVRLVATQACAMSLGPSAGSEMAGLAADPDPVVRAEAAIALARVGETDQARAIVSALAEAPDPAERVQAMRAMARATALLDRDLAAAAAQASDPRLRASGIAALATASGPVDALVVDALDDDVAQVRRASAVALHERPDAAERVLAVVEGGSARAQDAALAALPEHGADRTRVRAWAIGQLERATTFRHGEASLRSGDWLAEGDATLAFLVFVLDRRASRTEDRLLAALGHLGASGASGPIRRALRSNDPDVRGQALEALDALGDPQLAGSLVRLLEADDSGREGIAGALATLRTDPDPWVRALALRALADRNEQERRELAALAARERASIMDTVLEGRLQEEVREVTETRTTLSEMDRILFLRRVPLFGGLEPEDLQRIAMATSERLYAADAALVREGEPGDELIVIVDGQVKVFHGEGPDAQLLTTFGAGDHIGELAVLRSQRRSATVVADGRPVRGLVIDGGALRAVLAERPEAAMAMLATLADRIAGR
jgi:HEAT repeat protein/ATP/ADP translocase